MKKRILCVEDNETMGLLVKKVLENDFDVKFCLDGKSAIDSLMKERPDLVILDIMLPDMTGHDICSVINSEEHLNGTPVIMLSSKTDIQSKITSYELGAINYVEKPFDIKEFRAMVSSILSKSETDKHKISMGNLTLFLDSQSVEVEGKTLSVTPSEFKLLVAIVKEKGELVNRSSLTPLFKEGQDESIDRVINYHMSLLRKKIELSNVQLRSVYGKGYRAQVLEG